MVFHGKERVMLYRILFLIAVLIFSLVGCSYNTLKDSTVDIGKPPLPPPAITPDEKRVLSDIFATGKDVSNTIESVGTKAHSDESKLNRELWILSGTWIGRVGEIKEFVNLEIALCKAVTERVALEERYASVDLKYKLQLEKLRAENVLIAREKDALNRRYEVVEAENKKYHSWSKKLCWTIFGISGLVGLIGIAFCFIRFGQSIGILVAVGSGVFYTASLLVFFWSYYQGTIITILCVAGGLTALALLLYSTKGAIFKKVFERTVTRIEEGRRYLIEEVSPNALKAFDSKVRAEDSSDSLDQIREKMVKDVKINNGLKKVSA